VGLLGITALYCLSPLHLTKEWEIPDNTGFYSCQSINKICLTDTGVCFLTKQLMTKKTCNTTCSLLKCPNTALKYLCLVVSDCGRRSTSWTGLSPDKELYYKTSNPVAGHCIFFPACTYDVYSINYNRIIVIKIHIVLKIFYYTIGYILANNQLKYNLSVNFGNKTYYSLANSTNKLLKNQLYSLERDLLADSETEEMEPEAPSSPKSTGGPGNVVAGSLAQSAPMPVPAPPGYENTRRLLNVAPSVSSYRSAASGNSNSLAGSGSPHEKLGKGVSALAAQIRKLKTAAMAPRILGTGDTIKTVNFGSLHMDDDNRCSIVHTRELYERKINITTSFDPSTLICSNCCNGSHRVLNKSGNTGHSTTGPACFVLSDQCFPAALPSSGIGECLKIIRIEDGSLEDLVTTFLRLTRGCDVTIGSVVLISSINHLGRVGPAAYAEDLVSAVSEIRAAFGGQVRAIHGFPMPSHCIEDSMTIRGLMEIEAWLKSVDKRRTHSLPATGMYFEEILLSGDSSAPNSAGQLGIPLRMPTSFFSTEKGAFVGLGWTHLASTLPALGEAGEQHFLAVLLQELNHEFALQLDMDPVTDRLLHTPEVSSNRSIIICGGSHASRLAKSLGSIRPEVVDLSVGGVGFEPRLC